MKREGYPSDLSEEQWSSIQSMLPRPKKRGRKPADLRVVLNAILYVNKTGCQWRQLPNDLLPFSTVHTWFRRWTADGTLKRIHDTLRERVRVEAGKEPTPSAASIDTQSVKTTELGGESGYDGGKKVKGRKRAIVVDTLGLVVCALVMSANVSDATAGQILLEHMPAEDFPRLGVVWADGAFGKEGLPEWVEEHRDYRLEIKSRPEGSVGFLMIRKRWVVERTFGWMGRYRRHSKDYEYDLNSSVSMIHRMQNRLKPPKKSPVFSYRKS